MDLETLIARAEITDVLYRYCRAIDRRDWALLRDCYHDDAYDDHGAVVGSVDNFVEQAKAFNAGIAATMHHTGNVLVEIDGDAARAESYVIAYHRIERSDGTGKDDVWGIRFVDRFERRDGRWRIAHRVVAHEWRRVEEVPAGRGRGTSPGRWGSHDDADPLRWILSAISDQQRL